jgi:NADPH:quinone reductase-like Zn-dependent oxidoreductase
MKAVQYARRGVPSEVVEVIDLETDVPGDGGVVIAVEASPINPSDLLTLTGDYGALPPLPAIPGNEGVGRVRATGAQVANVKSGDRVFLPMGCGTWREEVRVAAEGLVPLPEAGDPLQLSMLMINPPTAYLMLHEFVPLAAGDWVVQNAANSGVGNYVTELAALEGINVVDVVRRESLVAPLEELGAAAVVVDGPDLADKVAEATGGAKIRLALDAIGGDATLRLADCLATSGTVVNYGMLSGEACKMGAHQTVFKDISLRGFWLGRWFSRASPEVRKELYTRLTGLVLAGRLKTEIEATYPIEKAKEALAHAMHEGRRGKILFAPGGG